MQVQCISILVTDALRSSLVILFPALDAHCLLDLYAVLSAQALVVDPHFNTEPSVPPLKISKSLLRYNYYTLYNRYTCTV